MRRTAADAVLLVVAGLVALAFWLLPSGAPHLALAGADPPPPPDAGNPPPPGPQPQPLAPPPPAGNFQPAPPPGGPAKPAVDPAVNFLPADANVPLEAAPAVPGPTAELTANVPTGSVSATATSTSGPSGGNDAAKAAAAGLAVAGLGIGAVAATSPKKPPPPDCDDLWRTYAAALDWERQGWDALQRYTDRSGEAYQKSYAEWQGRNAGRHAAAAAVRAAGCGTPDA